MNELTTTKNQNMATAQNSADPEIAKMTAVKSCIDSGTELMKASGGMLQSAEGTLNSINTCLNSVQSIVESAGSCVIAWKEIDKEMWAMNIQFQNFSKEIDANLSRYKARIPIIEKQLDAINANLTKMLDFVLTMEAKTDKDMDFKMQMMDKIDMFLNTVSTTTMKLL